MDFKSMFTSSDILGIMLKSHQKEQIRNSLKDYDKDMKIAILNMQKEIIEELIAEMNDK